MQLVGLVAHLPIYLCWLVGFIFCLSKLKGDSVFGLAGSSAFGIFGLTAVTRTVAYTIIPRMGSDSATTISEKFALLNVVFSIVDLVAWVLLLVALFNAQKRGTGDVGR